MSRLLRSHPTAGYVHAEAANLERQLQEGDGIHWAGDPRLELRMGIVECRRGHYNEDLGRWVSKGEIVARAYEVWRNNEDGTSKMIDRFRVEDFDKILITMAGLRLDAPGHVGTLDQIDAHNDAIEAAASQAFKDAAGEASEHLAKLVHDTSGPKNVFRGMPGLNPDKQA